jgi:hypothetical protein
MNPTAPTGLGVQTNRTTVMNPTGQTILVEKEDPTAPTGLGVQTNRTTVMNPTGQTILVEKEGPPVALPGSGVRNAKKNASRVVRSRASAL